MKPKLDRRHAPIFIARFSAQISHGEMRAHLSELEREADAHGEIGVVVDLREVPVVTLALQRAAATDMRALFRRAGSRFVAVAHVVQSSLGRTLLHLLQSLAPPPFPSLVTASPDEALAWVRARHRARHGPGDAPRAFEPRVATGLARTLVDSARACGVDVEAVLERENLSTGDLASIEGYLGYRTLMWLVDALARRSGDDAFGLHTAEGFVDAASFGLVGFAARSSTTLREAIERTARYARLMNENTRMSVRYLPDGAHIVDGPVAPHRWPRQYAELSMASFVALGRKWTGVPFAARLAGFRHPAPAHLAEHERVFGCTPSFDQTENRVVIPAEVLDRPLQHGDHLLAEFFDGQLNRLARRSVSTPGALPEVLEAITTLLPYGRPSLATVSRRLALSERTLQRRLHERGASFSDLLDAARREAALGAVDRAPPHEIARACGYSDPKAFRRAFLRWTGMTPSQFRRRGAS